MGIVELGWAFGGGGDGLVWFGWALGGVSIKFEKVYFYKFFFLFVLQTRD